MNVLLVEDEKRVADFILRGLRAEGWLVSWATDGEHAIELANSENFNAIILDVMLPGISGIDVCQRLREMNNHTPILMLSALNKTEDKVSGLRMGADDYLDKPFDFEELIARVEAIKRRVKTNNVEKPSEQILSQGDIVFNMKTLEVTCAGNNILMTAKERNILQLFLNDPDRIYSRERILNSVWGANEDPLTNIVDVYIGRLRKKLLGGLANIETVRGAGYRLVVKSVQ